MDDQEYPLPGAYETRTLFPALQTRKLDAIFPTDTPEFVSRFLTRDGEQPVPVHIHLEVQLKSGDVAITQNWHTLLKQPRDFVRNLQILKTRLPPDTCWYFPGGILPENAAILVHAGFDLFDFTGVDLKAASGRFCLPDGDYPESVMGGDLCQCPGCQAEDLREHNRYALRQELALIRIRIKSGTFREFLEGRVRTRPSYVSILRLLDRTLMMEQHTPAARQTQFIASSGISLRLQMWRSCSHVQQESHIRSPRVITGSPRRSEGVLMNSS